MNRNQIIQIAEGELFRLAGKEQEETVTVFRRPTHEDSVDRMGRQLVKRMIEAGVIEPL